MRRRVSTHLTLLELMKTHWKIALYITLGVLAAIIIVQFVYPRDRMVPYAHVDGIDVGHWHKDDVIWQLDNEYNRIKQPIYFGSNKEPHVEVSLDEIGLSVSNKKRISGAVYPWYFRLIPSSVLWYHYVDSDKGPTYTVDNKKQQAFIEDIAGKNCHVSPVNASLKVDKDKLTLVPAIPGGECEISQVKEVISQSKPRLDADTSVRIPVTEKKAEITDKVASDVAKEIMSRVGESVDLKVADKVVNIPATDLYSWLIFSTSDESLTADVEVKKAKSFFDKNIIPLVYRPAGTTKITTRDFLEIDRSNGARGQTLDRQSTAESLTEFINTGEEPNIKIASTTPKVEYKRIYTSSNAGLSALMTNFSNSHKGTYGVAMYELSGKRRHAHYNGNKSFVTASTYKLFVAYSTIKRVDDGKWKWSDKNIANGRNRGQCFDDMIIKSDNPCAENLLKAVGYTTITEEMHALGLNDTSFISDNTPHSTALDEAQFLAQLYTGQLPISDSGRTKLLSAMKQQVFRQGIPAGISDGSVAGKVGFLWGLLHDASIVYSPKGDYVLVILTDNSSWSNIADLTREIEKLR